MKKGKLIVVEGGDFVGKSTFINKLSKIKPDFKYTREPGNKLDTEYSKVCEEIRDVLLNYENSPHREAQLFAAARTLHTIDIIDLINKGYNVIVDRYILSSFAYQGYANKLGYKQILDYNRCTLSMLKNENIDMNIIVFKIDEESLSKRKKSRELTNKLDVIEQREKTFFDKVNSFFNNDIYKDYLTDMNANIYEVDASKSKEEVFNQAYKYILDIIK